MKEELTVAVTIGGTIFVKINSDEFGTKEEMLQYAEKKAMLNIDQIEKYNIFDSEFV